MASREDEFISFAEAAASRLLGTAYLLCGDWHAAEDLTQTTLTKVFAAWHRIRNQDSAHAYAKRTLLNTYFVDCRRKRRGEVLSGDTRELRERAAEPETHELRLELADALAALPPKARAVVVLRYWEDMSIEQVAAHLGCSPGNVKSQSARALDKLRRLLGEPAPGSSPALATKDGGNSTPWEMRNGRDVAPGNV
jgi:RNA polymerase sigma-70 factor (sigma-E family)